jgi:hypothetical protein
MRDVALGTHDLIDRMGFAQRVELGFGYDRNPAWVERPCKRRRVSSTGDPENLRCRECHHFGRRVVAIDDIEVMEVATCCADNDDASALRSLRSSGS